QLGNVSLTGYDAANQVYYRRDPLNAFSYYFYDAAGRQERVRDGYGEATSQVYDLAGKVTVSLDELGYPTYLGYDAANRRTTTTDAYGNVATTVYDRASNVTRQIDELGVTTYFSYDVLNRRSHTRGAAVSAIALLVMTFAGMQQTIEWAQSHLPGLALSGTRLSLLVTAFLSSTLVLLALDWLIKPAGSSATLLVGAVVDRLVILSSPVCVFLAWDLTR
ncbi:MAG: RHS repeat protein, partial [Planctomycetes bacterium]|nr:RHS repeat protein [Planctomycetota bacterium]